MAVKCVTCTRKFQDIHALKSHQPKCRGRVNAHAHGFDIQKREAIQKPKNNSGRKLAQRMDVTEEEVVLERQELRERDDSEPARKRKNRHKVRVA
jgi:hypothetical protein